MRCRGLDRALRLYPFAPCPPQTYTKAGKGKKGEGIFINGDIETNPMAQDGYYAHTEATQKFEKVRRERWHVCPQQA